MDREANARLRLRLFGTTFDPTELRKCADDLLSDEAFLCAMEAAFLVREKCQTLDVIGAGAGQLRMWPDHALRRRASPLFGPQGTR